MKIGVVHGRFQPFHNDHLRYCKAGLERCDHLLIGITNPDSATTADASEDLARSRPENNPLTFYERLIVIRDGLIGEGVDRSDFDVVPFPINHPALLNHYVPRDSVHYVTIYDAWGRSKARTLREQGFTVEILWEREIGEKGISGMEVRRRIAEGAAWEHLVPKGSVAAIRSLALIEAIRSSLAKTLHETGREKS